MDEQLTESLKDLYKVQKKIDELNQAKIRLKQDVSDLIIESKLEGKKFEIGDRCISYSMKMSTQSLSQRYLAGTLHNYFSDQPEKADELLEYILTHREKTQKYQLDLTKVKQR